MKLSALQSGLGAVKALSVVSQHTALEISTTLHRKAERAEEEKSIENKTRNTPEQTVSGEKGEC